MFRNSRSFASLILAFVMIAQPLAAMAQDKTLKSGGAGSAAQNATSVDITRVRPQGAASAVVDWTVTLPAGVEVLGFDVVVRAELNNDLPPQTAQRSFGPNDRSGIFDFKLPTIAKETGSKAKEVQAPTVPGKNNPRPGPGSFGSERESTILAPSSSAKSSNNSSNAGAKPVDSAKAKEPKESKKESKSDDKTARKFGEGNISGGGNNGNNGGNNNGGGNGIPPIRPIRPIPTPTPKPAIPPKEEPARIVTLKAKIVAKFVAGNDLAAFSEFIQPTDAITGEMKLKGVRGNALQAKKLIHLNSVARLATECPAGQECFDAIAELRGAEANGQFKVSMEVIFANGTRRNTTRVVGNLFRPVRLSVDKVSGQQIANVLLNINGGGNREQFTKEDVRGIGILQSIGGAEK